MKSSICFLIVFLVQSAFGQSRYSLECDSRLIAGSRDVLFAQENIIEHGENRGPMIEKYLESCGLLPGNPYCYAGQYWCWVTACENLAMNKSEIPVPKSGLAVSAFFYARKNGELKTYCPEIDDLIIWKKSSSSSGHIERVIENHGHGWVETIGFNTVKIIGGQKLEGVFRQKRNIYALLGRLRILGLVGFRVRS